MTTTNDTHAQEPETSVQELWKFGPLRAMEIGNPECPILNRYTLSIPKVGKLRLHRFYPNTTDRDYHDHPWPFVTLVIQGSYTDVTLEGRVTEMTPGKIRYRSANHAHKTFAGPKGCTTIVASPHERKPWGFFPDGKWMPWSKYMAKFGHGMVCEDK